MNLVNNDNVQFLIQIDKSLKRQVSKLIYATKVTVRLFFKVTLDFYSMKKSFLSQLFFVCILPGGYHVMNIAQYVTVGDIVIHDAM